MVSPTNIYIPAMVKRIQYVVHVYVFICVCVHVCVHVTIIIKDHGFGEYIGGLGGEKEELE